MDSTRRVARFRGFGEPFAWARKEGSQSIWGKQGRFILSQIDPQITPRTRPALPSTAFALGVCLILLWGAGWAPARAKGPQGTKAEARAMIDKAAVWFARYGLDKTLAEINRAGSERKGEFIDRDLYIFAYDFNGVVLAHGATPGLIGKSLADLQDADGRYLIRGLMDTAQRGGGWYYYKWANPISRKIEDKMAYVLKIDDGLWIGCGVYGAQVRERAQIRIGVFDLFGSDRYAEVLRGIREQLAADGLGGPEVRVTVEDAHGSYVLAEDQVRRLADAHLDLVFSLGTSATIAVTRKIDAVPVVFSAVYDPVATGIAQSWQSSGNNTTGSSTKIPMARIIEVLQEFRPADRLAVLYSPGQKNSEAQLRELQLAAGNSGIRVVPVPLTREEEVDRILPEVVHTTDAIYLTGSSIVQAKAAVIVEMASRESLSTLTHIRGLVDEGVLLGICVDPYQAGRLAGQQAVKILKGARPSSIPIEVPDRFDLILNQATARAGKFAMSQEFLAKVNQVVE